MNKLQTMLLGRATSFRLNAYDDAAISKHLVAYVEEGTAPPDSIVGQRAQDFIDASDSDEQILVKAYVTKRFNGYSNLLWARIQESGARAGPLIESDSHFNHDDEYGPVDLFFWVPLMTGNTDPVETFVQPTAALTLAPPDIADEVMAVQHANRKVNQRCRDELLGEAPRSGNPKVETLYQLADQQQHRQVFLKAAANAQVMAGRWDDIFTKMLSLTLH